MRVQVLGFLFSPFYNVTFFDHIQVFLSFRVPLVVAAVVYSSCKFYVTTLVFSGIFL